MQFQKLRNYRISLRWDYQYPIFIFLKCLEYAVTPIPINSNRQDITEFNHKFKSSKDIATDSTISVTSLSIIKLWLSWLVFNYSTKEMLWYDYAVYHACHIVVTSTLLSFESYLISLWWNSTGWIIEISHDKIGSIYGA